MLYVEKMQIQDKTFHPRIQEIQDVTIVFQHQIILINNSNKKEKNKTLLCIY